MAARDTRRGPSLGVSFRLFGYFTLALVGASAPAAVGAMTVLAGPLDVAPVLLSPVSVARSVVVSVLGRAAGHRVETEVVAGVLAVLGLVVAIRLGLALRHAVAGTSPGLAGLTGPVRPPGCVPYARRPHPALLAGASAAGGSEGRWVRRYQPRLGAEVVVQSVTGTMARAVVADRPRTVRSLARRLRPGEVCRVVGLDGEVVVVVPIGGPPPLAQTPGSGPLVRLAAG